MTIRILIIQLLYYRKYGSNQRLGSDRYFNSKLTYEEKLSGSVREWAIPQIFEKWVRRCNRMFATSMIVSVNYVQVG